MHNKHLAFCGLNLGDLVVFGSWPGSLSPVRQNPSPAHSCWSLCLCAWWQTLRRWSLGFALPKPTFLPFSTLLLCKETSTLASNSFIVSPNWNLITRGKWCLLCTETLLCYLYQLVVCMCVLYKCACVCVLAWSLICMCVSGCLDICTSACGGQMLNLHVFLHFPPPK